jgi:hypothetical protein
MAQNIAVNEELETKYEVRGNHKQEHIYHTPIRCNESREDPVRRLGAPHQVTLARRSASVSEHFDLGNVSAEEFILVTPESIGMDKSGKPRRPETSIYLPSPAVCFRPIKVVEDQDVLSSTPVTEPLPRSNRFQLSMKRSLFDPFDTMMV